MLLRAMPVLHARTYNIDFRTGKLLIEPEVFSPSDSATIHNVAAESTRRRELAPSCGRYVVYGAGAYSIVGRTVRFSDLYSRCGKEPKYIRVDKENGRLAYGFVGLMIETRNQIEPFILSDELILEIYERCIKERWEETEEFKNAYDTMKFGFMDFDVQPKATLADYELWTEHSSGLTILEDTDDLREQVVYSAMSQAFKGKRISLCTSVSVLDNNIYNVVTCKDAASRIQEIDKAINQIAYGDNHYSKPREDDLKDAAGIKAKRKSVADATKSKERIVTTRKVESLDDLLRGTEVPNDNGGGFQKENTGYYQGTILDKGLLLGTVLGVTFVVVEIIKNSSPVLIALTSTATVILAGIEAKRIIDRFKS